MARGLQSECGFSVLEMIVSLVVVSLLIAVAAPQRAALQASFYRNNGVNQIEYDLRRARSEASARGAQGIVSIAADGRSYTVGIDVLPFSSPPVADQQLFARSLESGIEISAGSTLIFDSRGYLVDQYGELTSQAVEVSYEEETFCSGTLFPTGNLELDC